MSDQPQGPIEPPKGAQGTLVHWAIFLAMMAAIVGLGYLIA